MVVFLADDHVEVRAALQLVLEHTQGLEVIGGASNLLELFSGAVQTCPDLILLDAELNGLPYHSGIPSPHSLKDAVTVLRSLCPHVRLIATSTRPEAEAISLAAEVDGFISKTEPPENWLEKILACQAVS